MSKKLFLIILSAVVLLFILASCADSNRIGSAKNVLKGGKGNPGPQAACNDHIDNDGDGFCDFLWKKSSCMDGSTPGDPDCLSKSDDDEAGSCVVECNSNDECEADGVVDSPYCGGDGNVYEDFISHTCDNAGTCQASCSQNSQPQLIETCSGGCTSGSCNITVCGNGIIEPGEVCDDGSLNGQPNQCNTFCNGFTEEDDTEIIFECNTSGSCNITICGNGIIEFGEVCDDGTINGQEGQCNNLCNGITEEDDNEPWIGIHFGIRAQTNNDQQIYTDDFEKLIVEALIPNKIVLSIPT